MAGLPPPVTTGQEYAAAILDELRGLRADLAAAPKATSGRTAELREPVTDRPASPRKTTAAKTTAKKTAAKKSAAKKT